MDGISCIKKIRDNLPLITLPKIVVMSGFDDDSIRDECYKLGIKDFLPKPFTKQ